MRRTEERGELCSDGGNCKLELYIAPSHNDENEILTKAFFWVRQVCQLNKFCLHNGEGRYFN